MLVAMERERADVLDRLDAAAGAEPRAVSVITVSELLHGVHRATGAHRAVRLAFVEHLLAAVEPVPITTQVARVHARIWADLAAQGRVPGAHDLWIGATARAHGWPLATLDRTGFERIEGLELVPLSRDAAF